MTTFPARASEFPNDNHELHDGAVWVCVSVCGRPRAVVRPAQSSERRASAAAQNAVGSSGAEPVEPARPAAPAESVPAAPELPEPDSVELDPVPVEVEVDDADVGRSFELTPSAAANVAPPASCREDAAEPAEVPLPEPVAESELPAAPEPPELVATPEPEPPELVATPEPVAESELPAAPEPPEPPEAPVSAEPDGFALFVEAMSAVALAHGATRVAAGLAHALEGDRLELGDAAHDALLRAGLATGADGGLRLEAGFLATAEAWREVLRGQSDDLSACGADTLDGWASGLLAALLGRPGGADELRRELRRHGVAAFGMIPQAA